MVTASKNADTNMGAAVGASLLGKLNLPGAKAAGGYQPRMFGQQKPAEDAAAAP